MKNLFKLSAILMAITVLAACNSNSKVYTSKDLKDISDSASYLSGIMTGEQMRKDTVYKINIDVYIAAIKEAYSKDSGFAIATDQRQSVFERFQLEMDKKLSQAGDVYLENVAKAQGVEKLDGGVLLQTINEGTGELVSIDDSVSFHVFVASNNNPKIFDSKNDSKLPWPYTKLFDLGPSLIEGLPLAMSKMKKGGVYKVYIPYNVGKLRNSKAGDVSILTISDITTKRP